MKFLYYFRRYVSEHVVLRATQIRGGDWEDERPREPHLPQTQMYGLAWTFALTAGPCSTPLTLTLLLWNVG